MTSRIWALGTRRNQRKRMSTMIWTARLQRRILQPLQRLLHLLHKQLNPLKIQELLQPRDGLVGFVVLTQLPSRSERSLERKMRFIMTKISRNGSIKGLELRQRQDLVFLLRHQHEHKLPRPVVQALQSTRQRRRHLVQHPSFSHHHRTLASHHHHAPARRSPLHRQIPPSLCPIRLRRHEDPLHPRVECHLRHAHWDKRHPHRLEVRLQQEASGLVRNGIHEAAMWMSSRRRS